MFRVCRRLLNLLRRVRFCRKRPERDPHDPRADDDVEHARELLRQAHERNEATKVRRKRELRGWH